MQHDYIVRQVQQLARVLAQVLFHRRAERPELAQEALSEGLQRALGLDTETLRRLSREDLIALCASGGVLSGGNAVAVADLLSQDDADAGRERALWLYEAALTQGEAVPFDIGARMSALRVS